jgi:secreted Zn-dependent insulinase-like peptidase
VDSSVRQTHRMLGFCFQVTSSSHGVHEVHAALDKFIESLASSIISSLSEDEFVDHVRSVISKKLTPFPSLHDAAGSDWSRIDDGSLDFTADEDIARFLTEHLSDVNGWQNLCDMLCSFCDSLFIHPQEKRQLVIYSAVMHNLADSEENETEVRKPVIVSSPSEVHQLAQI